MGSGLGRLAVYDAQERRIGAPDPLARFDQYHDPDYQPPPPPKPGLFSRLGRSVGGALERAADGFGGRVADAMERSHDPRVALASRVLTDVAPAAHRMVGRDAVTAGSARAYLDDVSRGVDRGGAESFSATGIGLAELVGADEIADRLRAIREDYRRVPLKTTSAQIARGGARMATDVAQFAATGAGGAAALRGLAGVAAGVNAARATGAGARAVGVLSRLAEPTTRVGRLAQQVALGAPVNTAIAVSDPEESMLGVAADFTGNETLHELAQSPAARVAAEIGLDVVAGGIIEGLSKAPRPAGAGARRGPAVTTQADETVEAVRASEGAARNAPDELTAAADEAAGPSPLPQGFRDIDREPDTRAPTERAATYDRIRGEVFGEEHVRENPTAGRPRESAPPDEPPTFAKGDRVTMGGRTGTVTSVRERSAFRGARHRVKWDDGGKVEDVLDGLSAAPAAGEGRARPSEAAIVDDSDPYMRDDIADEDLPDLTPYDAPDIKAARRQARRQTPTIDLPDEDGARAARRRSDVDRLYANRGEAELGAELGNIPDRATARRPDGAPKSAFIVLGPPASGKSTSIRPIVKANPWAVLIDADEAKKLVPEYDSGRGAGIVHEESDRIVRGAGEEDGLLQRALAGDDDLVWPMVGTNPERVQALFDRLARAGYQVHVTLNEVSLETSIRRAIERFRKLGRFLDPEYILSVGDGPVRSFQAAKSHPAVASYRHINNDVPKGGTPHVLEEGRRGAEGGARAGVREHGSVDRGAGPAPREAESHPKPDPAGRAAPPGAARREVGPRLAGLDGAEDRLTLPDGSKTAVRYRVVEAASLIPSHDAESFAPRPDYPAGVQGRRYHADKNAQAQVAQNAQTLDPDRLIRDSGTAGGTPIVTPDGIVLAGNQRTMMLQRARALGLESAGRYKAALIERAERYGLTPGELEGFELPVLVREVTDPNLDIADPAALRRFNDLSDTPTQKAKSAVDEGMTRASRLREATESMGLFARTVGADESLRDFLGDARGTAFARQLVADGVFSPQEVARFIDVGSGKLTTDGKNLIEQMMYAAAVGDADVLQRALSTVPSMTRKLDAALPAIIRANAGEAGLGRDLADALDLLASVAKHKQDNAGIKNVADLLAQGDVFGRAEAGRAQILAELLEGSKKADVTARFRRFATLAEEADRAGQADDMFGYTPPSQDELFIMAFTGELPGNPGIRTAAESPLNLGWSQTVHLEPRRLDREADDFVRRNGLTAALKRAERIVADPKEAFLAKHGAGSARYAEAVRLLAANGKMSADEVAAATRAAKQSGELESRDRFERGQEEMFGDAPAPPPRKAAAPKEDAGQGALFLSPRTRPIGFASEQLPDAGAFTQAAPAEKVAVSAHAAIRRISGALNDAMGLVTREGKMGRAGRKALGFFKPGQRVIRQRNAADAGVFAHEMGHAIHELLFGTNASGTLGNRVLAPFKAELDPLAVGISDQTTREGWAEFWRRWIDNPDVLKERAPVTLAYVNGRIEAEFPGVWNALNEGRDLWRQFREGGAQARIAGQISRKESRNFAIKDRLARLRKDMLDDLAPLERVMKALTGGKPNPDEDVITLARAARRSHGVAELFVERHTLDFATHEPNGKGMKQILEPVKDRLDQFRIYLVAERADELMRRGIETGLRPEDVERALGELRNLEGFREAAEEMYAYNTRLLEYLRDAGVMDQRLFEKITSKNQRYVPFFRARDDEAGMAGRSLAFASLFNPTKRIKGSGREIIDPLESILKNTYAYVHLGHKQDVSKALGKLAKRPGAGQYLERVEPPQTVTKIAGKDVADWVSSVIGDELDPKEAAEMAQAIGDVLALDMMKVFRAGDYFGKEGMISVLTNGKREWYQVDPELYKALAGLDREQLAVWAKVMSVPASMLRAGATLAPEFPARNVIRDQFVATVQSEYGYNPTDFFRGLSHLFKKDEVWEAWRAGAGGRASLLSLDRKTMRSNLSKALLEQTAGDKVKNVVRSPLDLLRAMSELMEDATRLGEGGRAIGKLGRSKYAKQLAGQAGAEITTDFGRKGAALTNVRAIAAFWNARLQSYDRMYRSARANPGRFAARATAAITVPSIGLFYLNKDDPDYWEVPQWQRDIFWLVPLGKDDEGHTSFARIPKPFELGIVFGTIPERMLEWMHSHDPKGLETTLKDFAGRQVTDMTPTPTALLPLLENYFNFSVFRQRPIVSRGLEEVKAKYQTTSRDSDFAKGLGRMLNYSPAKIDNLLFAYTGGLGRLAFHDVPDYARRATGAGDVARPSLTPSDIPLVRGFAVRRPGRSSESIERFYDARADAREGRRSIAELQKTGQRDELRREGPALREQGRNAPVYDDVAATLDELRAQVRKVEESRSLDGAEKRKRINRIEDRMTAISRRAIRRRTPATE